MSEATQWDTVRSALVRTTRDDATRVENPAWPGTPDVNYCLDGVEGWIELKQIPEWPARETTVVAVDHFTPQQRVWITRRAIAGGRVHLLLKVGRDWLLFKGEAGPRHVGKRTRKELIRFAQRVWAGGLDGLALRVALAEPMRP